MEIFTLHEYTATAKQPTRFEFRAAKEKRRGDIVSELVRESNSKNLWGRRDQLFWNKKEGSRALPSGAISIFGPKLLFQPLPCE